MSRRLMLATGAGSAVVTPTDPPPIEPDPDPDPPLVGWPETDDPNILALRPSGRTVLATITGTPGDNMADLYAEFDALLAADPLGTPYGPNPPDRSLVILLPPGEYEGGFYGGDWISIVGTSGDPADVVIASDTIAADGTFHPVGVCYIEGVTFKASYNAALDQSPKYCAHIGGSSATTFVNVIFDATEASAFSATPGNGNAGTVGMDGRAGTYLTYYGCEFYDITGLSRNQGMNLHSGGLGTGEFGGLPSKISFIDCVAPAGVQYSGVNGDEVYVIGGTIGGDIASENSHVYTNLANSVTGSGVTTTRDHTTWPIPAPGDKGMVEFWHDYYLPSGATETGTIEQVTDVSDRAPMSLVSGRIYYCPIPLTETLLLNRFGLWTRSGSGTAFRWRPDPDNNQPIQPDEPAITLPGTTYNLPNGKWFEPFDIPRVRYHGANVWVVFSLPSATGVTVDGSAELPGLHDCYYSDDDGATLVQATAGTPFPLAHAAQVR